MLAGVAVSSDGGHTSSELGGASLTESAEVTTDGGQPTVNSKASLRSSVSVECQSLAENSDNELLDDSIADPDYSQPSNSSGSESDISDSEFDTFSRVKTNVQGLLRPDGIMQASGSGVSSSMSVAESQVLDQNSREERSMTGSAFAEYKDKHGISCDDDIVENSASEDTMSDVFPFPSPLNARLKSLAPLSVNAGNSSQTCAFLQMWIAAMKTLRQFPALVNHFQQMILLWYVTVGHSTSIKGHIAIFVVKRRHKFTGTGRPSMVVKLK